MERKIELKLATAEDAEVLHKLQLEAFMPLYEKYQDEETSPAKESIDKIRWKIIENGSEFYIVFYDGKPVGGIRMRNHENNVTYDNVRWISPIFVTPSFQNLGIAQKVLQMVFKMYSETDTWKLDTIKQEVLNCRLYEKCGFVRVGEEHVINEYMTLVDYERKNPGV